MTGWDIDNLYTYDGNTYTPASITADPINWTVKKNSMVVGTTFKFDQLLSWFDSLAKDYPPNTDLGAAGAYGDYEISWEWPFTSGVGEGNSSYPGELFYSVKIGEDASGQDILDYRPLTYNALDTLLGNKAAEGSAKAVVSFISTAFDGNDNNHQNEKLYVNGSLSKEEIALAFMKTAETVEWDDNNTSSVAFKLKLAENLGLTVEPNNVMYALDSVVRLQESVNRWNDPKIIKIHYDRARAASQLASDVPVINFNYNIIITQID